MTTLLPLCVDLDGTLLRSDTLIEQIWCQFLRHPFQCLMLFFSLCYGIAYFKQRVALREDWEPCQLPYNPAFAAYLKTQYQQGRPLYLVTASDQRVADRIAKQFGLFTEVLASDGRCNLKAAAKAEQLVQRFGKAQFVYAGNAQADLSVWAVAKAAIVVNANRCLIRKVKQQHPQALVFDAKKGIGIWIKAIRVHHFVKNLLLVVPLLLGHFYGDRARCYGALLGFIAFCLAAASVYLLNDLVDLETDRQHFRKKFRPLASGDLSLIQAGLISFLLLCAAFIVAGVGLGKGFILLLASYYGLTLLYSFYLKGQRLLDIFSLAMLYTLRIIAGIIAVRAAFSPWLISFSMFFFFSLALVKRYNELYLLHKQQQNAMRDKMYSTEDMIVLKIFGINAGYLSVMILSLYIQSDAVRRLYIQPNWLWGLVLLLLFWLTRLWLLAAKGWVDEDPVAYSLKDRVSWVVGLFALLWFGLASWL